MASTRGQRLRAVAMAMLLAIVALAAITARAVQTGEREMRLSDDAFNRGDVAAALAHARKAAVSYAPGAPHVSAAFRRMTAVAIGSEARGDSQNAVLAWEAVRGAALETRHVVVARRADLDRADKNLARLLAGTSDPEERQRAYAALRRDTAPRARWVALLFGGFVLSFAGLAWIAVRGISRSGTLIPRAARLGAALTVLGVVAWTVAVYAA